MNTLGLFALILIAAVLLASAMVIGGFNFRLQKDPRGRLGGAARSGDAALSPDHSQRIHDLMAAAREYPRAVERRTR